MRHRKEGRKLSRTASHRAALLSALSTALFKHKKIRTTLAKAKEARRIVEPIITRARDAHQQEKAGGAVNVSARREIAKFIRDREAVKALFTEIAEKVGTRAGGYTRVVKLGRRLGDAAEMAVLELVDYNLAQETSKRKARVAKSKAAQAKKGTKKSVDEEPIEVEETKKLRGRSKILVEEKQTEETVKPVEIENAAENDSIDIADAESPEEKKD